MENRLVVLNRLIVQLEKDVDFMDKYLRIVQEASHDLPPYRPQSADEEIQQTATFHQTEGAGEVLNIAASHAQEILDDSVTHADLKDFLARPVRIASGTWLESNSVADVLSSLSPWYLFFSDSRIKNKLHNFAFLRANLHIKVVLSASPFYYGRALLHYQPLPAFKSQIPLATGSTELVAYSQRPHVWLRPEDNDGAEMVLPFLWPKNWLNVRTASEFVNMGSLFLQVYSVLKSANAAVGTGVPYQVYAWAEDVVLSGATLSMAMQSRDEYVAGPISGPATAIAKIADTFKPVFGPYATATSMALRTTAAIARLFGYTNVPVQNPTHPMRVTQFANFASTEIGYPLEKLTIDAKNELTVDPSVLGLGSEDELTVKSIVTRDSYLASAPWLSTYNVGTTLFYANVTPRMMAWTFVDGSTRAIQNTPMGHVARMFDAWRGDVIFTFDVVASQYHKGRLQIAYDPQGDNVNNVVNTSDPTSGAYTVIVDLAKERTVELRIPYQQAFGWLLTGANVETILNYQVGTSPTFTYDPNSFNGALCVKVLNALTAPVAATNVDILVRVRGGDNLEFANPQSYRSTLSMFRPQGEETVIDTAGQTNPELNTHRGLMNYGESVRSLRPLIRRTAYATPVVFNVTSTSGYTECLYYHMKIPPYPGFDPTGLYTVNKIIGTGSTGYNWGNMSAFQWLLPCFVGYRGSTFWHYNPHGQTTQPGNLLVTRLPGASGGSSIAVSNALGATMSARAMNQMKEYTSSGVSLTNPRVSAGSAIAVPMMSRYLMHSTDPKYATSPSTVDDSTSDTVVVTLADSGANIQLTGATQAPSIDAYCGAGTDFNMFFFLNTPTVYYNPAIPTPI